MYRPVWLGVVILSPFLYQHLLFKTKVLIAKRFDYPTVILFSGNKEHERQKCKNNWKGALNRVQANGGRKRGKNREKT